MDGKKRGGGGRKKEKRLVFCFVPLPSPPIQGGSLTEIVRDVACILTTSLPMLGILI